MSRIRKIIHIDMDAFYASVELRERPHLRGQPVVVAWDGPRSVICAASYEARRFGLHSAMAVATAKRLCPQAVYIPPNFPLYRSVSQQIHTLFARYTDVIEPLSLDEAYLDVTDNLAGLPSATAVANAIRADIVAQTGLTASAGVAPNKYLAKIASDWRNPNGQFVLRPSKVAAFLQDLPLGKIPGVGKVTLNKMQALGLYTAADLARWEIGALVHHFGRYGYRLHDLARGIDERPVQPGQRRQQISTETTLDHDLPLAALTEHLAPLISDLWIQAQRKAVRGRCVHLKLKTADFKIITRSLTYSSALHHESELHAAAQTLLQRVALPGEVLFRLIGIGLSQLEAVQAELFECM